MKACIRLVSSKIISLIRRFKLKLVETRYIDNVRGEVDCLAIVSPDFRGVKSATREMISSVIEVSNIHSRRKAREVAFKVLAHKPKKILISGYAKGHDVLAEEIHKIQPGVRLFVLIHSAFIWFDMYPVENPVFERFIELAKSGVVEKVGFCKRDLAEYFASLGVNAFFVMNRFSLEEASFKKLDKKNINIGIFGQNQWHRNITNQVVGALMVKNTKLHVNEMANHFFLDKTRIKVYGILPKPEFLKIYKKIDINMYVSMTDCFPMVVIESMQNGIPCLVSDTSDVYGFSPKLKKWLTVSTIDGPIGIAKKLQEVIDNHSAIQAEIKNYLPILKQKVEASIEEFLK